ncbi:MAG: polyamine ABC transporter ATP-binding protein [Holosporales bacterium]|nr:polyamine ABC transporter ATP-binding protein [Holosporales bacterium]
MAAKSRHLNKIEPWHDPEERPYVYIENLTKDYDGSIAVDEVTLSVYRGELFSLLGRSGCGKSTLLRMLAGFEIPSSGRIYIDGIDMSGIPPHRRPVSMVFQSYALFPHMNVEQNVAFGLKQEKLPKSQINERVNDVLELVQMLDFKKRKPHQLSGGQRQRIALARSLVKRPKLLLLDEPLAALDKKLREKTQLELVNIQEEVGITFIMVSHDQEEAMTMASRIGIMADGRIIQVGTPTEIYEYPNSKYVSNFVGTINMFEGVVMEEEENYAVVRSSVLDEINIMVEHSTSAAIGAHVSIAIRPEKVVISKRPPKDRNYNCVKGIVQDIVYLGDVSIYHVELANGRIVYSTATNLFRIAERPIQWDDEVYLYWLPENSILLTA